MENTISIITQNPNVQSKNPNGTPMMRGNISAEVLQKNMASFLEVLSPALNQAEKVVGGYDLEEIELKLEVSAEGSLSLIGTVQAGAVGGITLKFKRAQK